jgi:hypothetical protein
VTLPTELDFTLNPAATPERMDAAMTYIVARIRALEAIQPEFQSVINQLRAVGLERLAEALTPIFTDAQEIIAVLEQARDEYEEDAFKAAQIAAVLLALRDGVDTEFDTLAKMAEKLVDYRSKYLGALAGAPTLDDNGDPVVAGATYFDTTLNRTRVYTGTGWVDAGSVVEGILRNQDFTAVGGETSVTVPDGYDPGNIIVSVNGLRLANEDVVVTSGTVIDLPAPLVAGDVVSWTKFGAITIADVYTQAEVNGLIATVNAALSAFDAAKLSLSGGTMTGRLKLHAFTEKAAGYSSGAIDTATGSVVDAGTISSNVTVSFANLPSSPATGDTVTMVLRATISGTPVITWPGSIAWAGNTAPTLAVGAWEFVISARWTGSAWAYRGAWVRFF